MRQPSSSHCDHKVLTYTPSPFARAVGYRKYAANELAEARTATGKNHDSGGDSDGASKVIAKQQSFPAPLVLPDDELAHDPTYPPQSVKDWVEEKDRNEVTRKRNVIYIAGPPAVDAEVDFVRSWTRSRPEHLENLDLVQSPALEDIVEYVGAFYHGMPTKILPLRLTFAAWDDSKVKNPKYIALNTDAESTRIRTRQDPTKVFQRQLNLNDILDAELAVLPPDAYALMLIVDHDLYEDEEDAFCCGRAYGGSRIAVVSAARYHPGLDGVQDVDREHAWPASHCKTFVEACCAGAGAGPPTRSKREKPIRSRTDHGSGSGSAENPIVLPSTPPAPSRRSSKATANPNPNPLKGAVAAHSQIAPITASSSPTAPSGLWMSRVCRTVSHELGHCFGSDHCMYYACVMQGTASLAEDVRQPPYLCAVDLEKVLRATGGDVRERYEALLGFCERRESVHVLAALGAWLRSRLRHVRTR